MKKYLQGFTLVELLVVITIIGVLSTLTVVYLEAARMSARDARRLSDVKQIQLALKMYYNDLGIYPTSVVAGSSIANGGTNYLLRTPTNPKPYIDNDCPEQDYQYQQLENGQRYTLSFCLGTKIDDLDPGIHVATHSGILNCPENYVAVPGSAEFDTNDFCVMKYEAKCALNEDLTKGITEGFISPSQTYDNGGTELMTACIDLNGKTPVSLSTGYPIANITVADARNYCARIGAHLITNQEWMTIARNAETVANNSYLVSNWNDGEIGQGSMPRGVYYKEKAEDAEFASEYFDAPGGLSQPQAYMRRTFVLSTGQKIWDMAGNVSEWVDETCKQDTGGLGSGYYYDSGAQYIEWNDQINPDLADYEIPASGPSSGSWTNSIQGIGQYNGCTKDGNIFIRGGSAVAKDIESSTSGIYELDMSQTENQYYNPLVGFRCVK